MRQFCKKVFICLIFLSLLTPLLYWQKLLFPFVTTKAFFFRAVVELALPFYFYLLATRSELRPNLKNPLTLCLIFFLASSLISCFLGVNQTQSFWGSFERMGGVYFLAHLVLLYFYVLLLGALGGRYLKLFLTFLVYAGAAVSFYAALVRFNVVNFFNESDPLRVASIFGNPIFFAGFVILPFCLAVFFAFQEQSPVMRRCYWALAALQAYGIFLSGTRGVIVGLFLAIFLASGIYFLFLGKVKFKIKLYAGLALGLCGLAMVFLVILNSRFPQNSPVSRIFNLSDSNSKARLIQWQIGLAGFKQKPFFGIGPENYSVVANRHYRPEIYKFDESWFDKPHNFLVEVLATGGIFGFISYFGIIIFGIWAIWAAYKAGLVAALEACALLAGLLAYQIQNLFAFDTVSSSLVWYVCLGFLGFLWQEAALLKGRQKKNPVKFSPGLFLPGFGVLLASMVYVCYATNWAGLKISHSLYRAYELQSHSPSLAKAEFDKIQKLAFHFYESDFGYELGNFALNLNNNPPKPLEPAFIAAVTGQAITLENQLTVKFPNEPRIWLLLARLYGQKAKIDKQVFEAKSLEAASKAAGLAPLRPEPGLLKAELLISQDKLNAAEEELRQVLQNYPENFNVKWQLAEIYYFTNRQQQALELAGEVLSNKYVLKPVAKLDWLIEYYVNQGGINSAIKILENQIEVNLNDPDLYARLATFYLKAGNMEKAKAAALKVGELDPESEADMREFIKQLR